MRSFAHALIVWGLLLGAVAVGQDEDGLPLPRPSDYGRGVLEGKPSDPAPAGESARTPAPAPASDSKPSAPAPVTTAAPAGGARRTRGARGALLGEEPGSPATVTRQRQRRVRFPAITSPKPEDVRDLLRPGDELTVTSTTRGHYEFLGFSDETYTGLKVRRGGAKFTLPLRNVRELTVDRYVTESETVRKPTPARAPYVPPAPPPGPSHTIFHPDDPRQRAFPAIPASDSPRGEFTREVRVGGRAFYVVPGTEDWLSQLGSDAAARKNDPK